MGRMIDADAFDKRVRLDVGLCEEELTEDFKDGISTILEMMKTAPTVDSVPVVRCKDCKYWRRDTDHTCKEHSLVSPMLADGFCSRGERKDGDHAEGSV